jgi:hypothetical protein
VIGLVIGLIFAQGLIASFVPSAALFLPYALAAVATSVAIGEPVTEGTPIWLTAVLTVGCLGIAVRRLSREDF